MALFLREIFQKTDLFRIKAIVQLHRRLVISLIPNNNLQAISHHHNSNIRISSHNNLHRDTMNHRFIQQRISLKECNQKYLKMVILRQSLFHCLLPLFPSQFLTFLSYNKLNLNSKNKLPISNSCFNSSKPKVFSPNLIIRMQKYHHHFLLLHHLNIHFSTPKKPKVIYLECIHLHHQQGSCITQVSSRLTCKQNKIHLEHSQRKKVQLNFFNNLLQKMQHNSSRIAVSALHKPTQTEMKAMMTAKDNRISGQPTILTQIIVIIMKKIINSIDSLLNRTSIQVTLRINALRKFLKAVSVKSNSNLARI